MHQLVDDGGRGHRILEDLFPLGEDQMTGDQDAAALVAFSQDLV